MQPTDEKVNRFPVLKDRLNALLMDLDLTTTDFAKKVGITRQTMGYYLNGERIPDSLTLVKICESCNVSANWLLGLSDTKSLDTNVEAIMQYTGLTESNVNFLHNPPTLNKEGAGDLPAKSVLMLVNDIIESCQENEIQAPFFQLQWMLSVLDDEPARRGFKPNYIFAQGGAHRWGYTVLPIDDSIAFYSSQIAKVIENKIANKYHREHETFEENGWFFDDWGE